MSPFVRSWLRLALCCVCLAVLGCSRRGGKGSDFSTVPPKDVQETNAVRKKLGIRLIKPAWTFYGRRSGAEDWADGKVGLCKRVQRAQGASKILWEQDYYYTGATYVPPADPQAGSVHEVLTISYHYGTKRFHVGYGGPDPRINAWMPALDDSEFGHMGKTNEETLSVADKALSQLGLQRL